MPQWVQGTYEPEKVDAGFGLKSTTIEPQSTWNDIYFTPTGEGYTGGMERWQFVGDFPEVHPATPDWLTGAVDRGLFESLAIQSPGAPKQHIPSWLASMRNSNQYYSGDLADIGGLYWAGDRIGFPAFEQNLFTQNINIPDQFQEDRWYGLYNPTNGQIEFQYRDPGPQGFGEFLSAAMLVARVAGMISGFGGTNLLGDLAGSLGFGGGSSGMSLDFDIGGLLDFGGGGYTDPGFSFDFDSLAGLSGGYDAISGIGDLAGYEYLPGMVDFGGGDIFGGYTNSLADIAGYMDQAGYASSAGGYSPAVVASAPSTQPSLWSNVSSWLSNGNNLSRLASLGSSLYGMSQSRRMRELAAKAAKQADPFGPYRGQYAQELAALSANPSLITSRPGYQFRMNEGLEAVRRRMAASGYSGSGNEAIALTRYGQDYASAELNSELARLANLAGAQFAPQGGQYLLQGNQAANTLASQALASAGYGLATNNQNLQDIIMRAILQGQR